MKEMRALIRSIRHDLDDPDLAAVMRRSVVMNAWRRRSILRDIEAPSHLDPAPGMAALEARIAKHAAHLEARAEALRAGQDSPERQALVTERDELSARRWLAGVKDDVLAQINRLKEINALEKAKENTKTNQITSLSGNLANKLVTEQLRQDFAKEAERLGIAALPVALQPAKSRAGVPYFQLCLQNNKTKTPVGKVLSEGEHRSAALAVFLAELSTTETCSGIVFDDPVSSLDHINRDKVATRLAEEGRRRQVIVFTHDLRFYSLLRDAHDRNNHSETKTKIASRHIQKLEKTPGCCKNSPPEKAKAPLCRLQSVCKHLKNTSEQFNRDPDGTEWRITVRGLIDEIRQIWEAGVEEAVAPVLRRFSDRIETKNFVKLAAIKREDAEIMRKHYKECSVLLHQELEADNSVALTPDDIKKQMDALRLWLMELTRRQKQL